MSLVWQSCVSHFAVAIPVPDLSLRTSDRCHWCGNLAFPILPSLSQYQTCHCEPVTESLVWQSCVPHFAVAIPVPDLSLRTSDRCHWCGNLAFPILPSLSQYQTCHCEPVTESLVWQSCVPHFAVAIPVPDLSLRTSDRVTGVAILSPGSPGHCVSGLHRSLGPPSYSSKIMSSRSPISAWREYIFLNLLSEKLLDSIFHCA